VSGAVGDSLSGIESLFGSAGGDVLKATTVTYIDGRDGNDSLVGGTGSDTLIGGTGSDTLTGGANADYFILSSGTGRDRVTDFDSVSDLLVLDSFTLDAGSTVDGVIGADVTSFGAATLAADDYFTGVNEGIFVTYDSVAGVTYVIVDSNTDGSYDYAAELSDHVTMQGSNITTANGQTISLAAQVGSSDAISNFQINGSSLFFNLVGGLTGGSFNFIREGTQVVITEGVVNATGGAMNFAPDATGGSDTYDLGFLQAQPSGGNTRYLVPDLTSFYLADESIGNSTDLNSAINDLTATEQTNLTTLYTFGFGGDDTITGLTAKMNYINAGIGNDSVVGGSASDTLLGDAGLDTLKGGDGADFINGGADGDRIFGDAGLDTLQGGGGDDFIYGGADEDRILGEDGNDYLDGNDGNDFISGLGGNDTLLGGAGVDFLDGSTGDDVFIINNAADHASGEIISGFTGSDVIRYTSSTAAETLDLQVGVTDATLITVVISDTSGATTGTAAVNVNATALVINQTVSISGNDGNNVLTGNDNGVNSISGQGGNDTLVGGGLADYLMGGEGADSLFGGAGADYMIGGAGSNTMTGGSDADIFWFGSGPGTVDYITDWGDGSDVLSGTLGSGSSLFVTMSGSNFDASGIAVTNGVVNVTGSSIADTIKGGAGADTLIGGTGSDVLYGGAGDSMVGGADGDLYVLSGVPADIVEDNAGGSDTVQISTSLDLTALGNDLQHLDVLDIGTNNVTLTGTQAAYFDSILGAGNLWLTDAGDLSAVSLSSGIAELHISGNVSLTGVQADGFTSIVGGVGSDAVYLTDSFSGALGADFSGVESIFGSTGNDTLVSSGAAIYLNGGDGLDSLVGGAGADTLTGGVGIDNFIFETTFALNGSDLITDFSTVDDLIRFNFGQGTNLSQADLRGTGVNVQFGTGTTALLANAGLFVYSGSVSDATVAEAVAEGFTNEAVNDLMYLLTSTNSASLTTVTLYSVNYVGVDNASLSVLGVFDNLNLSALGAGNFSQFTQLPPV
jgi:Ca2+-binding RTX toxin-like protein